MDLVDVVLFVETATLLVSVCMGAVPLVAVALLLMGATAWFWTNSTDGFMPAALGMVGMHLFTGHHYLALFYVPCLIATSASLRFLAVSTLHLMYSIYNSYSRQVELVVRMCVASYMFFVKSPIGVRCVFVSVMAQNLVGLSLKRDVSKCMSVSLLIVLDAVIRGVPLERVVFYGCISMSLYLFDVIQKMYVFT